MQGSGKGRNFLIMLHRDYRGPNIC
uniref:Uncharacterized protein n=1 Tax=Arundo donax TaxID=35708 RepID=A0A0A9GQP8_ARUDO